MTETVKKEELGRGGSLLLLRHLSATHAQAFALLRERKYVRSSQGDRPHKLQCIRPGL